MSSDDGGYVHTPGALDDDESDAADATDTVETDHTPSEPEAVGFGSRGWLLVAVVVVAFLVIPLVVYSYPAAAGGDSLPFLVGLIALPMLPALLLGLTAVWTMTAAAGDAGRVEDDD